MHLLRLALSYPLFSLCLFTLLSVKLHADDKLVILSPHRKSIQQEFIPKFSEHYRSSYGQSIQVEWLDQGGTENDLRYIRSKFAANPKTAHIDIFWGGGDLSYYDLDKQGLLLPTPLPASVQKQLPSQLVGLPIASKDGSWYASALSSFGLFYNQSLLQRLKLKPPSSWQDLAEPHYLSLVSLSDPRHSASSLMMNIIMLYSTSWEEGWKTLSLLAGNTQKFTHSSSDPIKAVVSGDAVVAPAIDFYAYAKIAQLDAGKLGFVLPAGKTLFNSDPIAVLKGAPNLQAAQRFLAYVLSKEAQKLLVLPQGHKLGPQWSSLGRMAVNPFAYEDCQAKIACSPNPFTMETPSFVLPTAKLTKIKDVLSDLFGAVFVDLHDELKKAWRVVIKSPQKPALLALLSKPPLSEKEVEQAAEKWHDQSFRNQSLNQWAQEAKARYGQVLSHPKS